MIETKTLDGFTGIRHAVDGDHEIGIDRAHHDKVATYARGHGGATRVVVFVVKEQSDNKFRASFELL